MIIISNGKRIYAIDLFRLHKFFYKFFIANSTVIMYNFKYIGKIMNLFNRNIFISKLA